MGDLLRSWAVSGDDTVLDPGIGTGVLSHPLLPGWEHRTDPEHVVGIDRSPLARLLSSIALTLYGQSSDIRNSDFFDIEPTEVEPVDAIVANPPYTSAHVLDTAYRTAIANQTNRWTSIDIGTDARVFPRARNTISSRWGTMCADHPISVVAG